MMTTNPGADRVERHISPEGLADLGVGEEDLRYTRAIAARMLGDAAAAEDIVQDALLQLLHRGSDDVADARGWLVVVVRRLCINHLRSAYKRREGVSGGTLPEPADGSTPETDPVDRVTLDDEVTAAMAVVLDRLSPAERTAFVLHDIFGFSFGDIASITGRSDIACRQLASRARRALRAGGPAPESMALLDPHHEIVVERFIAACAGGDLDALIEVLDPDIVGEATLEGVGSLGRLEGSRAVASKLQAEFGPRSGCTFVPVPLETRAGIIVMSDGTARGLLRLDVDDRVVAHIHTFLLR